MIHELTYTYDENENGYVTQWINLEGDIYLIVRLKEEGRLTIKKKNDEDAPAPKVLVTSNNTDYELRIYGETIGKYIQLITSAEPQSIQYADV